MASRRVSRAILALVTRVSGDAADRLQTFGFVVLRQFFAPGPLATELERALGDSRGSSSQVAGGDAIRFQYVPMMTAETPVSLSLLDRLAAVAELLLGGSVLPTRAKRVRYSGDTPLRQHLSARPRSRR